MLWRSSEIIKAWFVAHIAQDLGLLPNLIYLKVNLSIFLGSKHQFPCHTRFHSLISPHLAPVVGTQLISLTVRDFLSAQIPYVLRTKIPTGLLAPRSLTTVYTSWESGLNEGASWYEIADESFCEVE